MDIGKDILTTQDIFPQWPIFAFLANSTFVENHVIGPFLSSNLQQMKLNHKFCQFNRFKQAYRTDSISEAIIKDTSVYLKKQFNPSVGKERQQHHQVQKMFYLHLAKNNHLNILVSSLFQNRSQCLRPTTSGAIKDYLMDSFPAMSDYQKYFLGFYYSILRDASFFGMLERPRNPQHTVFYSYAALINQKQHLVDVQTIRNLSEDDGSFRKQTRELRCFFDLSFSERKPVGYHKRSRLEETVELILRNLKIPFAREQYIQCYRTDFVVGDSVIDVLGPSHYVPDSTLRRGQEIVKENIIAKSKKYLMVEHFRWSKLNGLQEQRQFVSNLLRNTRI